MMGSLIRESITLESIYLYVLMVLQLSGMNFDPRLPFSKSGVRSIAHGLARQIWHDSLSCGKFSAGSSSLNGSIFS